MRISCPKTTSGLPVLRQYEIEDAASAMLYSFSRNALSRPEPLDAEGFVKNYLHLSIRLGSFYDDYLCAAAFEPQAVSAAQGLKMDGKDVAVSAAIIENCDMPLYRYALMHAAMHHYLHNNINQSTEQMGFDLSGIESINRFVCTSQSVISSNPFESQADNFALSLLMPKYTFKLSVNTYMGDADINRAYLKEGELEFVTQQLASLFDVPHDCVLRRLKRLNYIKVPSMCHE